MNIQELKENFINQEIWILTFGGAFQRANIYNSNENTSNFDKEKKKFRTEIKEFITENILPQYEEKIDENQHVENIIWISNWSKNYSSFLKNNHLKIGVSQKLLNLYLKYKWCLNLIKTPPHCPFDSIIIKELGCKINWTQLDNIEQYKDLVNKAKEKAKQKKLSIAEWELEIFQRRN